MQSNVVLQCNYTIKKQPPIYRRLEKKELFEFLLERLPKETLYAFSKKDLKFKRTTTAREATQKGKFLFYNQNLTTELIFDIDKISHLSIWNLDAIYRIFYEKFGLMLTWSCKTDKGVQFCISLNTFYKLSKKQKEVLRDFKQYVIDNWALIDKAGSKRLKGWWRNPFTQQDFKYYGNVLTFSEILDFLKRNKLDIKQHFKAEVRKKQIKQSYNKIQQSNKIRFTIGEPIKGNRNNFVWYNLMLTSNSKNLNTLLQLAKELNKKTEKELDEKELEKVAKSVLKYNEEGKNFIYSNSKKAGWNIGKMGFEKIKGLDETKYKKEVKRRQKMAGKKIGKHNIENYVRPKAEATKEKVYKAIEELKQKEEKITVRKVKELAKVSIASASKYLKQAREQGII